MGEAFTPEGAGANHGLVTAEVCVAHSCPAVSSCHLTASAGYTVQHLPVSSPDGMLHASFPLAIQPQQVIPLAHTGATSSTSWPGSTYDVCSFEGLSLDASQLHILAAMSCLHHAPDTCAFSNSTNYVYSEMEEAITSEVAADNHAQSIGEGYGSNSRHAAVS